MARTPNTEGTDGTDGTGAVDAGSPAAVSQAEANHASASERALVQRLIDGDEATFAGLVEDYHGRLLRLARSFVREHATAEEVVQETWIGVLKGLRTFEGRSALKTWIFRILVNRAKTRGVREARSVPFSALGDDDGRGAHEPAVDPARFGSDGTWLEAPRAWDDDTPEKILLRQEARQWLERAIEGLPPRQRTVLVLRDIERVSADEVCNILAIAETNQRVMLHRARSVLHRALERYRMEE